MSDLGGSASKKMKAAKHPMEGGSHAAVERLKSWNHAARFADNVRPQDFAEDVEMITETIVFLDSENEGLMGTVKFLQQSDANKNDMLATLREHITKQDGLIRTLETEVARLRGNA